MRYKDILTPEQLFEVNMSPSNLQKLVKAIPGAKAGLEFEMIVPDVEVSGGDNFESEPDYDMDERCRSIRDAYDFFYSGEYNSRRSCEDMQESMYNDYHEWHDEKLNEDWCEDYLTQYIRENANSDEWEVEGEDPDAAFEAFVEEQWRNHGNYYDLAREQYWEENDDTYDESDWLDDAGLNRMSNVSDNYDMTWPYWTEYDNDDDEPDISEVADSFDARLGRGVQYATGYHDIDRRDQTGYIIEPDGSLNAGRGDFGLEFVSPPLSIPEMLVDLKKVVVWAIDNNCYTGKRQNTGLHMNISVPNYSLEKLDYIKLAILLGDEHVLAEFGRTGNTYCKSAMAVVRDRITSNPGKAEEALEKMKNHLALAASKAIHSGTTDKFTSINTKNNRVEFRGPGGDWINMYKSDPGKLVNPMLRMVVALDAACDPEKYKQEYQKKLYKLLNPAGQKDEYGDMINEFSKYVSAMGGAAQEVVRDFRRATTSHLTKGRPRKEEPKAEISADQESWEIVNRDTDEVVHKFTAAPGTASGIALAWLREQGYENPALMFKIRRDVDLSLGINQPDQAMRNDIYRNATQQQNQTYQIVKRGGNVSVEFMSSSLEDAKQRFQRWLDDGRAFGRDPAEYVLRTSSGEEIPAAAPLPGSTTDIQQRRAAGEFTGAWKVVNAAGNEVYRFGGVGNSQTDANRVAVEWLRSQGLSNPAGFEVLPIMGNG